MSRGKGGRDFLTGAHAAQGHPRGQRVELQEDEREVAPQLARPEPHAPRPDVGEDAGAAIVPFSLQSCMSPNSRIIMLLAQVFRGRAPRPALGVTPSARRESFPHGRIIKDPPTRRRKSFRVPGLDQYTIRLMVHDARNTSSIGSDNRQARRHGLNHHEAQRLTVGRHDEHVRRRVRLRQSFSSQDPDKMHAIAELREELAQLRLVRAAPNDRKDGLGPRP
mmetsp:Transcript_1663/g.4714  ORF Transcript_1663/g.4714 Transcript_1663/m.4714 type:complete len:221 (+) Transcript_1663:26-688(+)